MNIAPFCVYIKDADGRYLYANPALITLMRGGMADDRQVLREGKPTALDNRSVDHDGTVR